MARKLQLEIVTPEKVVFSGKVDYIVGSGTEGVIGVLARHIPFLSRLESGELKIITEEKKTIYMALAGGFIQVEPPDKVTILADTAVRAESIDEAKVIEAKKRAESLLTKKLSDVEFVKAEAALRKSLAELKVVRRRRRYRPQVPSVSSAEIS